LDPQIEPTVSDFSTLHHPVPNFLMPKPRTPPHSQIVSTGSVLSKTTPLKRDISGTAAHSSTPHQKASDRYPEMTREASEKFVGPMPIALFLSEFIPRASTERPTNEIALPHSSVSQNEDAFVRSFAVTCVFSLTPITDTGRLAQSRNLASVPTSNLSTLPLTQTDDIV